MIFFTDNVDKIKEAKDVKSRVEVEAKTRQSEEDMQTRVRRGGRDGVRESRDVGSVGREGWRSVDVRRETVDGEKNEVFSLCIYYRQR